VALNVLLVLPSDHSYPAFEAEEEAVSKTPGLVQDNILLCGEIDAVGGLPILTAREPEGEEQLPCDTESVMFFVPVVGQVTLYGPAPKPLRTVPASKLQLNNTPGG
jgi:hypothetical protein